MEFEWEVINNIKVESSTGFLKDSLILSRAKVFGGWIIRSSRWLDGEKSDLISESMVFMPDLKHEWIIDIN